MEKTEGDGVTVADKTATAPVLAPPRASSTSVDRVLGDHAIRTHFQPIVRLEDGAVIGHEALSRGPADTPLEPPVALFAAARRRRRVADLDQLCLVLSLQRATAAGLVGPLWVCVNVEAEALGAPLPARVVSALDLAAEAGVRVVLDVTEAALLHRPVALLRAAHELRRHGAAIALDDVGCAPEAAVLVALLAPEVIKLDLAELRRHSAREVAAIRHAVNSHAERTGCLVLAEGVESDDDVDLAAALGAVAAQGFHFGHPRDVAAGPQPDEAGDPTDGAGTPEHDASRPVHTGQTPGSLPGLLTPGEILAGLPRTPVGVTRLQHLTRFLEDQAGALGAQGVLLASVRHLDRCSPAQLDRWSALAADCLLVGVVGQQVPPHPADGVRGGQIHAQDPLAHEWDVAVLGPHFAAALVARAVAGADGSETHEHVLTYDRALVSEVVRSLIVRLPQDASAQQGVGRVTTVSRDTITGLADNATLSRVMAQSTSQVALLTVRVGHVNRIEETHGRTIVDEMLRVVGQRLQGVVRDEDLVARLDDHRFAVLLTGLPRDARNVAETVRGHLREATDRPLVLTGCTLSADIEIDVTLGPSTPRG